MNYSISSKARIDLIGIWEFTKENWSVQQADKYYQIIRSLGVNSFGVNSLDLPALPWQAGCYFCVKTKVRIKRVGALGSIS
jgi:hypothetical protein